MTRRVGIAVGVVIACLSVLGVAAAYVLDHDRVVAEDQLAAERLQSLTIAARGLGTDLVHIGDDLALVATLPEVRTLAQVKRGYLEFDVRPAAGDAVHVEAPGAAADVIARARPVVERMLAVARVQPGELHVSSGLSDRDDIAAWYRVFAHCDAAPGAPAVATVIDMRVLVSPPEVLRAGSSRLLVLSAHNVPAPASDRELADAVRRGTSGELDALVADARARRPGTTVLDASTASALGLPDARAVAAAVPVEIDGGAPWILAVVSSTDSLQARHDALVARMVIGGALGLSLVLVATLYIMRNARRAELLRERLRHADLVAGLTDKALRSEKLATAGQLAAGIAHEIGTPLNVARGRAEMVLAHLPPDHPDAANLRIVTEQIDHVTTEIQQLLGYVRPPPRHVERVAPAATLRLVADLLEPEAAKREIVLTVDAEGSGDVRVDPGQLRQVVVNLVTNAIDACSAGGRVALRARQHGNSAVAIEVADTGCGIAPADRAHVFDPFFTTKKRGRGTGLGLWIVAEIARAHDAELEVDSAVGTGTTVRVVWPS